jgi:hypothetical protein
MVNGKMTAESEIFPSRGNRRGLDCEECGEPIPNLKDARASRRFCTDKCRYRARDRKRYAADPEFQRERSRRYYRENREVVLARAAAKRSKFGQ